MSKKGNIPKLRFPEFQDSGEWESRSIQSLLDNKYIIGHLDGNHGALYPKSEEFTKSGIPYISANDFLNGFVDFRHCKFLSISRAKQFKKGIARNGDILFAHNATVGPVAKLIMTYDYVILSTTATYFRCDNHLLVSEFLKFTLSSPDFVKQYTKVMSQSTRNQVPITTQRKFNLSLPSLPEQQRIADCLTSLDEVISNETAKLEAYKSHKKGLMQKLFPGEEVTTKDTKSTKKGATENAEKHGKVPEWRFPEFRNSGEWEMKRLGEIANVTTGNKDTQDKIEDGEYPFFVRSQTVERINSFSLDCEAILTSGDGVGVGKNFHYYVGKFDFHQRVYCIYDFGKSVYGKFIYLYFSEHFFKRVNQLSAKNSVDSVRMAMITEMSISIPSLPEQQKIADCLTSHDDLISAQANKIEKLKLHKKGLMQGLFPSGEKE